MSLGLLLTAFAFGLQHGIDVDHVAAISDIVGATDDRRQSMRSSLGYACGHAVVVFALGAAAVVFGAALPDQFDQWMGRVVGMTLVLLGTWVLLGWYRHRGDARPLSRASLVLAGASGLSRRGEAPLAERSGAVSPRAASGVGVLHGVGVESPTQIAVFVASTSVAGAGAGLTLLAAWVIGLVIANAALAAALGESRRIPERHARVREALTVLTGVASVFIGVRYLVA